MNLCSWHLPWEKDTEQSFLQQFEEQVEGESDDGWRRNYAHARELLVSSRFAGATEACEYESDEDMPILLQDKWQSNFTRACTAFVDQLRLLRAHWASLSKTLASFEKKMADTPAHDVSNDYAKATVDILNTVTQDHYRGLLQLQVFQYWHRVLFEKAASVLDDRGFHTITESEWWNTAEAKEFRNPTLLQKDMQIVVARYAKFLTSCKARTLQSSTSAHLPASRRVRKEEAEALLSRRRMGAQLPAAGLWLFGLYSGAIATFSLLLGFILFFSTPIPSYDPDVDLWSILPYFRGYLVLYVAILLWGFVVYHMELTRVNYPYVLGLKGKTLSPLHIAKIAAMLLALWMMCFTLYMAEVKCGLKLIPVTFANPKFYIFFNAAAPLLIFLCPFDLFERQSRQWLWRVLVSIVCTPAVPVTFASNMVTDYLTSMVRPLVDFTQTMCALFSGGIWYDGSPCTGSFVYLPSVVIFIPLAWRFMQCFRKAVIEPVVLDANRPSVSSRRTDLLVDVTVNKGKTAHAWLLGTWKVEGSSSQFTVLTADSTMLGAQDSPLTASESRRPSRISDREDIGLALQFQQDTVMLRHVTGPAAAGGPEHRGNHFDVFVCTLPGADDGPPVAVKISAPKRDPDKKSVDVTCILEEEYYRETRRAHKVEKNPRSVVVWPHSMNALKYFVSLIPVVIGFFHSDWKKNETDTWTVGRVVYIIMLVASTAYSFWWDIFMDWGLWRRDAFPPMNLHPWVCGLVWRPTTLDTTMPKYRYWYYVLVFFNAVGRCAWALTLVAQPTIVGVTDKGNAEMLDIITCLVEVMRRSVWARFRLGHEHQVDVGNYRPGDGYHTVPPLISRKTPWTTPGEFSVLRTLKVDPSELMTSATVQDISDPSKGWFKNRTK
ncbi:SPX and EXS domain-containing protein 1 [Diplonema papillatum]|nr:SPX and EXS domain-containing protein 1 [Diplonema papillatum]